MKATMTENREYRTDVSWPTMKDLTDGGLPESFLQENEMFYKLGMNRQRQKQDSVNNSVSLTRFYYQKLRDQFYLNSVVI